MDLQQVVALTTALANVATFLGIPLAIIVFIRDRRQTRLSAEIETYQSLQSQYATFLRLCLERSDLALYDYQPHGRKVLDQEQEAQRMIGFEMVALMCESAFFLYHQSHRSQFRKRQWTGWDQYMRDWAEDADFRRCWREHLGTLFDTVFISFMNGIVQEVDKRHNTAMQPTGFAGA